MRIAQLLKHKLAIPFVAAGILAITPMVSQAAADVAKMSNHGSAISWHPSGTYAGASLSVGNPDGTVTSQNFDRNEQIAITTPGTDGLYTYELVLTPMIPTGLRARMDDHRANHPGEKFMGGLRGGIKSGSFRISGGAVLESTLAE